MIKFNHQFKEEVLIYTSSNSGVKHIKYVDEAPLTVSEMYRRAVRGIPLSVPTPKNDRIPLNNRFYVDDFDVLDISIRNDMRISEEKRQKMLEENEYRKREIEKFKEWKKQQAELTKNASEKES